mgnify:CR=1 FL=1
MVYAPDDLVCGRRLADKADVTREGKAQVLRQVAGLRAPVDRFFVDVLVMAEDAGLRQARLRLLMGLRRTVEQIADISELT